MGVRRQRGTVVTRQTETLPYMHVQHCHSSSDLHESKASHTQPKMSEADQSEKNTLKDTNMRWKRECAGPNLSSCCVGNQSSVHFAAFHDPEHNHRVQNVSGTDFQGAWFDFAHNDLQWSLSLFHWRASVD